MKCQIVKPPCKFILPPPFTVNEAHCEVVVVPENEDVKNCILYVIGGATRLEAIYEAIRVDPHNPCVMKTLHNGCHEVMVMHPRIPRQVLKIMQPFS